MEEKKAPWWRRALSYALDGIRSGFGLFSRAQKHENADDPEIVSGQKPNPEEDAELTEDSPLVEPISEAMNKAEIVSENEPRIEAAAEPTNAEHAIVITEPVIIHVPTFADEQIPELTVSSVESNEPVIEEPPEHTDGELATNEAQSQEEAALAAEAGPDTVPATEQVAEIAREPAEIPMELNEPIPEQPAEPVTEVETDVESEPAAKAATEQVVQSEAALQDVDLEPVIASEPAVGDSPVERVIPTEVPPVEAASEPVDEVAPVAAQPAPAAAHKPFVKLESRDNQADLSAFSVFVSQVYDGPLDLLLDLIRKQDIDIYDIPIARITAQFLAYVNQLKATDVDVAGDFIYIASLLIHIKSKMLLPRAPAGPDEAAEDPRRELVERLLEHERFKNAAQMLQQKQMLEAATWTNPGLREFKDDQGAEPEIAADTVDLVRVFRDILERARNRPVIDLEEDSVTVGQMIQFLARRLTIEDKPVALRRLLSHTRSERALIAMFLALLELVRLQAILLRQDRAFSEIFIKKHTGFESIMNEGLANAQDDWR